MGRIKLVALSILLPVTLLLLSFSILVLFLPFYHFQNLRLSDDADTGKAVSREVVSFLGAGVSLDQSLFNPREISHMEDVLTIVDSIHSFTAFVLFLSIIIIILYFQKHPQRFHRDMIKMVAISFFGTLGAALIFSLLAFSSVFRNFHLVLFNPGTYLFNRSDALIIAFPLNFFQQFAYTIVIMSLILHLVIILVMKKQKLYKRTSQ